MAEHARPKQINVRVMDRVDTACDRNRDIKSNGGELPDSYFQLVIQHRVDAAVVSAMAVEP